MAFKRLGVMLDMSRNAVMHVPALKKFIAELAYMGYNTLLLYTEDTYEVPGEPYFGHFRGRYSQEEIRQLVAFADNYGMEVIPCIQTLAHLNAIFRWKVYQPLRDCNDILLAEDDRVYEFIGRMLDSVKACYASPYVHIGMDEAHMVGLGKYLDKNGFQDRFGILSRHLKKVCEMAEERGLKPIIWGDMYFRLKNHGVYNYLTDPVVPTPEEAGIPENVDITYWDYYITEENAFTNRIKAHKALGRPVWFAGGYWIWGSFAPHNRFSIRSTLSAVRSCRAEGVENIFFTMWGDDGGECSRYAVLPSLYAGACFAQGQEDMDTIRAGFEARYGIPFDSFLVLDMHPDNGSAKASGAIKTPEKYLLYNDPFLGVCDSTLDGTESAHYQQVAAELARYADHPEYGPMFASLSQLAAVLSVKSSLGLQTRRLYQAGDKAGMAQLLSDYDRCSLELDAFLVRFRSVWMAENTPFGFEIQELRLGGLLTRLKSCRERLYAWCENGTPIPELAEENLDLMGGGTEFAGQHLHYPHWRRAGFTGVLSNV